jgi:membrane-bound metal-dependent hydrolase YbcI (DUF457 family)
MPDYTQHLKYGWIAHFAMSLVFIPVLYILGNPIELVFAVVGISLPLTLFASVLPDVDHHSSNTNKLFRFGLFITVITLTAVTTSQYILSIGLLWMSVISTVPLYISVGTVVAVSLLTGGLSILLFRLIRPSHRGITHTIPFIICTTLVVAVFVWQVQTILAGTRFSVLVSLIVSSYYLSGIVSHLKADNELIPTI